MPARDADARALRYFDAAIRNATQNDAILRFVDYWKAHTLPDELVFDSCFTAYANLANLTAQGMDFITLRRRHASLVKHIEILDKSAWKQIRLPNDAASTTRRASQTRPSSCGATPSHSGRSLSRDWHATSRPCSSPTR